MNEILNKYAALYEAEGKTVETTDPVLYRRVRIGELYCADTALDTSVDAVLDERLRELSALGEEDLIDCIFDAINAPIYKRRGMI